MALFTTEIVKELLVVSSSSICRTIFKEKKQTGLNYSKYSLLASTGFLASQLIATFAVTICGLVWIDCLYIFVYWSKSTSYSCLYSSL